MKAETEAEYCYSRAHSDIGTICFQQSPIENEHLNYFVNLIHNFEHDHTEVPLINTFYSVSEHYSIAGRNIDVDSQLLSIVFQ